MALVNIHLGQSEDEFQMAYLTQEEHDLYGLRTCNLCDFRCIEEKDPVRRAYWQDFCKELARRSKKQCYYAHADHKNLRRIHDIIQRAKLRFKALIKRICKEDN